MIEFLKTNVRDANDWLREYKTMDKRLEEKVIHICEIPNERYISCNRYIVKCKDGIV